ncbi:TPA: hypothetical protein ACLAJ2_002065, partial [Neisseria meningitidis]
RGNDGGKVAVFPINSCRSSFLGWREIKQKRAYQKNNNAKNGVGNFKVCALAALIRKKTARR